MHTAYGGEVAQSLIRGRVIRATGLGPRSRTHRAHHADAQDRETSADLTVLTPLPSLRVFLRQRKHKASVGARVERARHSHAARIPHAERGAGARAVSLSFHGASRESEVVGFRRDHLAPVRDAVSSSASLIDTTARTKLVGRRDWARDTRLRKCRSSERTSDSLDEIRVQGH